MTRTTAEPSNEGALRVEKAVYGGDSLLRTPAGEVVLVPFTLPGELVERSGAGNSATARILESSPARVKPRCIHFGACGGCQYQMANYHAQLAIKADILRETLARGGTSELPEVRILGSPDPWGYRNRIRLRVREVGAAIRLGYSVRATNDFLPVSMCPIAAPALWQTAEALMEAATHDRGVAEWMRAAAEIEVSCTADGNQVRVHLLCPGENPRNVGGLDAFARSLRIPDVQLMSVAASRLNAASGRATKLLASWGANGLLYPVADARFWLEPGTFFQVNRFLVPGMVEIVCGARSGTLAWDLYAGVGLFARRLAKNFAAVTAVEANPLAMEELRRGLPEPQHSAVQETSLAFLRKAALQRERPSLVVMDPPRAGAGVEVCELLNRLAPAEIVYVSCDPTTLARDLRVLSADYRVAGLHMVDLFPQTYHLETVMVLHRKDVEG